MIANIIAPLVAAAETLITAIALLIRNSDVEHLEASAPAANE